MIIAIDGPAGSGKSTVAKIVAETLNFTYIETGAMYRAVAWKARQRGVDLKDEAAVAQVAENLHIHFVPGKNGQNVLVEEEDLTGVLKDESVGRDAATVAAQPKVREILTAKQREIGRKGNVVMDGRDIGTVVFPQADRKFFLTAAPEARGRRRYLELKAKNQEADLDQIIQQVKLRDHEDENRAVAPLKPAEDSIILDTTQLNIEEVVERVIRWIRTPSGSQTADNKK